MNLCPHHPVVNPPHPRNPNIGPPPSLSIRWKYRTPLSSLRCLGWSTASARGRRGFHRVWRQDSKPGNDAARFEANVERNRREFLTAGKAVNENGEFVAAGPGEADPLGDRASRNEAAKEVIAGDGMITGVPGSLAGHQDRRLRARAGGGCRSARGGRLSRGMARHGCAHRGERCWRDAPPVRQPSGRSARRHRAVHSKLLLSGGR